jgi:hypothetical protein
MDPRVRAVCDLALAEARETGGIHDYDGVIQDLSPSGVRAGLARLGGPPLDDPVEEAHLCAFEAAARLEFHDLEVHRTNPLHHLFNLDVACYDRGYAPSEVRAEARLRHLQRWPDGVDMAIEALDRVPRPVASGLLAVAEGLHAGLVEAARGPGRPLPPADAEAAAAAHRRLIEHLQRAADTGDPDPAIGGQALARMMGEPELMTVDLGQLAERCDAERDRLLSMLVDGCARVDRTRSATEVVADLHHDHPVAAGVLAAARAQVQAVIAFTGEHDLAPHVDGECRVEASPPSRRWAMAMLSPAAPFEDDGPSVYAIAPPDPAWPVAEQEQWLEVFSAATLPAITVHEVAPGHFAHGRSLRRAVGDVRRALQSTSFAEGWAHYAEELFVEEGYQAEDPRFGIGVALEALIRVTRLAVAIGVHTRAMTMKEAVHRFEADALLTGPAARSEAVRATFDPGYGCYTFGKMELRALRERARVMWRSGYSHGRFHRALLELGSPPLGLMETVLAG